MSYKGHRKMGMFDHAKYSQPVFRNISQSVLTAVKKDVAALLKDPTEKTTKIHQLLGQKRHHSPIHSLRHESNGGINVVGVNAPTVTLLPKRIQNKDHIRELFDTTLLPKARKDQNAHTTGPNGESSDDFPEKPPMKKIVDLFMQSHPSVTLRPNEPTTLSDATFSLVRRALIAAKERNIWKERARAGQSSFSAAEMNDTSKTNKNPFQTLSDQTLFIQDEIEQNPFRSLSNQTQFLQDEIEQQTPSEQLQSAHDEIEQTPFQNLSDQTPFIQYGSDQDRYGSQQNPFQSLSDNPFNNGEIAHNNTFQYFSNQTPFKQNETVEQNPFPIFSSNQGSFGQDEIYQTFQFTPNHSNCTVGKADNDKLYPFCFE